MTLINKTFSLRISLSLIEDKLASLEMLEEADSSVEMLVEEEQEIVDNRDKTIIIIIISKDSSNSVVEDLALVVEEITVEVTTT